MNLFLTDATAAAGGMGSTLIMLVLMLAVFYFMLIRPENKRKKEAEEMRSAVKVGDKITTIGGICGTVVSIKDDKLVIETGADQVRIELAKWAMSTNETAAEQKKAEQKKAQEAKAKAKAEKKAKK
jgi:preprotein translocase subunit YajC